MKPNIAEPIPVGFEELGRAIAGVDMEEYNRWEREQEKTAAESEGEGKDEEQ